MIGAAVGTTITGALAAIGGSVPAKRTALAHVLFNLATGATAFAMLPAFLWLIGRMQHHAGLEPGALSLAAFHTVFIASGVAIVLPVVDRFARAIERVLPDAGPAATRHLDRTLLEAPAVALEATRRGLRRTACDALRQLRAAVGDQAPAAGQSDTAELGRTLERIQQFFATIPPVDAGAPLSHLRVAQMHAIDHLARLQRHLDPPAGVARVLRADRLHTAGGLCREVLRLGESGLCGLAQAGWIDGVKRRALELADLHRTERPTILEQTAGGASAPGQVLALLDALRWLDRVGYHAWRLCHHLGIGGPGESVPADAGRDPDDAV